MNQLRSPSGESWKWEPYLRWGIAFLILIGISPFVFLAIKGLLGLVVAFGIGFTALQFTPVFTEKIANARLKALKSEWRANPIESLQNVYLERSKQYQEAERQIVEFDTQLRNYDSKVEVFKKKFPSEAPAYQAISEKMHSGLRDMRDRQKEAYAALQSLQLNIDKATAMYEMSLAAQNVTKFSRSAEQKVFEDIKQKVAYDQIQTQVNRSFAQLDQALEQHKVESLPAPGEKA